MTPFPLLFLALTASPMVPETTQRAGDEPASTEANSGASVPKSIYRLSPWLDGTVTGAASLAIAVPYALSSTLIKPRCPCNPAEVNALDRGTIGNHSDFADALSTATVAVAIAGPMLYEVLDLGFSTPLAEDLVVLAEALAVNGALVTLAKYTFQRPIPRVYADPPGTAANYRSFYSGHTSTVFAALAVEAQSISARHGGGPWLWAGAVAIAGSVAVERVLAGYHFPTDVIFGAVMGTATGLAVTWLHSRKQPVISGFILIPRQDGLGVAWAKQF
jgi:membrane-associated phospholipid phosphatase